VTPTPLSEIFAQRDARVGEKLERRKKLRRSALAFETWSNEPTDSPADTTAPTITSSDTASVAEGSTLAHALTADESVTWTLTGGADELQFEISGSTLRWASNGTQDFETPADANTDNAYVVQVTATDQTVTVTVTDIVEATPPSLQFDDAANSQLLAVLDDF
jgi:hypothetical protein